MAVPPSICVGQLVSHWMDFYEILYLSIFQKYFEKIQISLKSAMGALSEDCAHL